MLDALCQPSFNIGGVFVFLSLAGLCFCSILRQGGWGSLIFFVDRNPEVTFGHSGPFFYVLRVAGCPVVANFPKCSPDLNAIEGQWRVLRERLEARAPDDMETRESFLARLRRTVDWLNRNRVEGSTQLCTNLKTRAHELKELAGARTKW